MNHIKRLCLLGCVFCALVILIINPITRGQFQHNWTAIVALNALQLNHYPYLETQDVIQVYARDSCQRHWLLGLAAFRHGDQTTQDNEWAESILCNKGFVVPIKAMQPSNRSLAELAVAYQPTEPGSWFWLATIEKESNPVRAIGLMAQGLQLRPTDGAAWYQLAQLYEKVGEPNLAIGAYITACAYLNQGTDCYVKAGTIYEQLGDIRLAIYYYRLSIFEGAHQRADWLEKQFTP